VSRRVVRVHHAPVVQLLSPPQPLPTAAATAQPPSTAATAPSIPTAAATPSPTSPAAPPRHVERQARLARSDDENGDAGTSVTVPGAAFAAAARVPAASVPAGVRFVGRRRAAADAATDASAAG